MKRNLISLALTLAVSLALGSSFAQAKTKKAKHTPEHTAALKKCSDDYAAAAKDAKGKKGKDRSDAMTAAKKAKMDCMKAAPQ